MKIAALSPQFIFEPPASAEAVETERVAAELKRLKLVPSNPSADHEQLEEETREGLKRLSEMIRRNRKAKPTRFLSLLPTDQRKHAFLTYRQVSAEDSSPERAKGQSLNKFL